MALVSNDRRERQGKYGHLWFEWVTYDIITSTFVLHWKKIRETVNLFLSKLTNEILLRFFFYKALEKNKLKVAIFF